MKIKNVITIILSQFLFVTQLFAYSSSLDWIFSDPNLSIEDKKKIISQVNVKYDAKRDCYFDPSGVCIQLAVDSFDLNRDGIKEVFVSITDSKALYGQTASGVILLIKNNNNYIKQFDLPVLNGSFGTMFESTNGYRDLRIGEGSNQKIYKWNGNKYTPSQN